MSTRDAINDAYKTAMKGGDKVGTQVLRLINSDLRKIEVDERRTCEEADVIQVLSKNIKKRREAIEAAQGLGRQDVVDAETAEMAVLQKYMPQQMGEAELIVIVEATIKEVGAAVKKDQGKVMQAVMPKVQGKADGKLVAQLVGARLK